MVEINKNIYDYILNQNVNVLDRTALSYFGRKYTFKDVLDNIDIVAKSLEEYNIKENDSILYLGFATPFFVYKESSIFNDN